MRANFGSTHGLVFSGQLLLDLSAAGMSREDAYRLVQSHALQAWETDGNFRAAVEADPEIRSRLSADQLARIFSVDRQLQYVSRIYERVFASNT
jgi:adenylosuccinate lyase